MVVREYMSGLQNKVQFPIQKHSSSQNGCDSQLDEKTFLSYLTAKHICACFGCEVTAVPGAGEWVIELCDSVSPFIQSCGAEHAEAFSTLILLQYLQVSYVINCP